jgi:hypothetical protein
MAATLGFEGAGGRQKVWIWIQRGIPRKQWPLIIEKTEGRVTMEKLESQARYMDQQKASAA